MPDRIDDGNRGDDAEIFAPNGSTLAGGLCHHPHEKLRRTGDCDLCGNPIMRCAACGARVHTEVAVIGGWASLMDRARRAWDATPGREEQIQDDPAAWSGGFADNH